MLQLLQSLTVSSRGSAVAESSVAVERELLTTLAASSELTSDAILEAASDACIDTQPAGKRNRRVLRVDINRGQ